jgi:hypothetical protein
MLQQQEIVFLISSSKAIKEAKISRMLRIPLKC